MPEIINGHERVAESGTPEGAGRIRGWVKRLFGRNHEALEAPEAPVYPGGPYRTPGQQPDRIIQKITLEQAEALFGADFMGPKQYEKAFGFTPSPEQIPVIPFSRERLERAHAMGYMLVLHLDETADGRPMTMKGMNTMQAEEKRNRRVICNANRYQNENFYTRETPRLSWRLVAKDIVPGSTSKNEVEQLELIIQVLQNEVFPDMAVPADYREAIDEFEAQKKQITEFMESDKWPKVSKMIEILKLNRLTRGTPAEMVQIIEMHHQNTGEYLFPDVCVRTPRRGSHGHLVDVGAADSYGVHVLSRSPGDRGSDVGVSLSLQS